MNKVAYLILGFFAGILVMLPFTIDFSVAPTMDPESPPSYSVVKVVDGDTIDVSIDGKTERIRFIGIDTPETVDSRTKVQCFGPEASEKLKSLLIGTSVSLEKKPNEDKDDYGRLLRYVFLNGKDIGAAMIEEGYAESMCAAYPHPKCAVYDVLEESAKAAKIGRWNACPPK